jgi:hypothetical protein
MRILLPHYTGIDLYNILLKGISLNKDFITDA